MLRLHKPEAKNPPIVTPRLNNYYLIKRYGINNNFFSIRLSLREH